MAVVIRLTRTGKKGERKFRVVVKEKRSKRDGKAIEFLGWYEKGDKKEKKEVKKDRYEYWVSQGAQPSATVAKLMK
ncbi:MAG: 30S ribosomal protein S16 [Candidatus Levybacteria bacterium]|nr:30S ribosomal protein S16 [Candidatus Levybacteria bacterium]